ncbi:phosphoglycerate kinase [Candidatus Bipolaricaulota bacterium]|nr:phosphoglycerate kinase [Candidatus Bipolaricaulota bacterium]HHR85556.1 phosphoglycerate kinase [Candidatus Acetothermia bacterium]
MGNLLDRLRRVQDAAVEGKRVVVRVDYNVPLADGKVADDSRIRASLPTLENILERGGAPILLTHLGRPEGKVVPALRLDPVAKRLEELLGKTVRKLNTCVGDEVTQAIEEWEPGSVILLENVRFFPEETADEAGFARKLAALGDMFVNDAFATLHRAHASTLGIADYLPAYAGLLVQKEIEALARLTDSPEHPYVAIIGGKKARSKLGTLRDLVDQVDAILIGGGVAFTFLRSLGQNVGGSIVDESLFDEILLVSQKAEEKGVPIVLPRDAVIAAELSDTAESLVVPINGIPSDAMGLDIGPETIALFGEKIATAKTIMWAGPMGAFEFAPFSAGTKEIGQALAESDAFTVVGGGETGEAVKKLGLAEKMSLISTGGGACLALLRGKALPALEALRE